MDPEISVMRSYVLCVIAGLIEIYHYIKYQLSNTKRTSDSTLDKTLDLANLAKVRSQWTGKYRS